MRRLISDKKLFTRNCAILRISHSRSINDHNFNYDVVTNTANFNRIETLPTAVSGSYYSDLVVKTSNSVSPTKCFVHTSISYAVRSKVAYKFPPSCRRDLFPPKNPRTLQSLTSGNLLTNLLWSPNSQLTNMCGVIIQIGTQRLLPWVESDFWEILKFVNLIKLQVCGVTDRKYTYAELRDRSAALAVRLQNKCGLKQNDVFAVCLPNIPEFPIATLGAIEAGLIVTTVNPTYTSGKISKFTVTQSNGLD